MSGQICLSRIRRARQLSPTAIQVVLPDWLPLGPAEVQRPLETDGGRSRPGAACAVQPAPCKDGLRRRTSWPLWPRNSRVS